MNPPDLQHAGPLAINMNQPGSFLHWSIFTVSVANPAWPRSCCCSSRSSPVCATSRG